ncbi:MAG TPA: hypothetical protein VFV52_08700 [Bacilli bacterium]|nr:hypothetical protein [Bacilli bacterium]
MRYTIKKGIFIIVGANLFDYVTTSLGFSKSITSFDDVFPMTLTQGICVGISTILYLYGLFVLIAGVANYVKRKKQA